MHIIALRKIIFCLTLQTNRSMLFVDQKAARAFQEPRTFSTQGEGKMAWVIFASFPIKPLMQCTKIYSHCFPNIFL